MFPQQHQLINGTENNSSIKLVSNSMDLASYLLTGYSE